MLPAMFSIRTIPLNMSHIILNEMKKSPCILVKNVVHLGYKRKEVFIMAKAEFIRARVEESLKVNTELLFSRLGLTMTDAITLFLTQCQLQQGLPFEVKIPNEETKRALNDAHAGVNMTSYANTDELFKELGI